MVDLGCLRADFGGWSYLALTSCMKALEMQRIKRLEVLVLCACCLRFDRCAK
jgi:hypothetical protein